MPGAGLKVPVWILGSSLFGAQLAAALGLPFAFASHFAPAQMMQAIEIYRAGFRPSAQLERPYVMLGFNVFAADTDEEARLLVSSAQQGFLNLRKGQPRQVQPPIKDFEEQLTAAEQALIGQVLACSAIGTQETVRKKLLDFVALTQADEIMIASMIYDHAARVHSYEIAADAARGGE